VGETTCDGKKRPIDIRRVTNKVYVMELPHKKASTQDYVRNEIKRFADKLEELTGNKITPENS